MATRITLENTKKVLGEIYPSESFFMDIEKEDGTEFADTNTCVVEIINHVGELIKKESMQKSVDKTTFEIRFFDTSSWQISKVYRLRARIKDSVSSYNDVVMEAKLTVQ